MKFWPWYKCCLTEAPLGSVINSVKVVYIFKTATRGAPIKEGSNIGYYNTYQLLLCIVTCVFTRMLPLLNLLHFREELLLTNIYTMARIS